MEGLPPNARRLPPPPDPRRRPPAARMLTGVLTPLLALALVLPACRAPESVAARDERRALASLAYPADAERGPDLDIAVERRGTSLALLNRTARVYRDQQLWLNRQYVNIVPVIAVGPGNTVALPKWVNRYAEPFPVGALLTPDDARAVVLAELYDPKANLLTPLTVWPDDTQDDGR